MRNLAPEDQTSHLLLNTPSDEEKRSGRGRPVSLPGAIVTGEETVRGVAIDGFSVRSTPYDACGLRARSHRNAAIIAMTDGGCARCAAREHGRLPRWREALAREMPDV